MASAARQGSASGEENSGGIPRSPRSPAPALRPALLTASSGSSRNPCQEERAWGRGGADPPGIRGPSHAALTPQPPSCMAPSGLSLIHTRNKAAKLQNPKFSLSIQLSSRFSQRWPSEGSEPSPAQPACCSQASASRQVEISSLCPDVPCASPQRRGEPVRAESLRRHPRGQAEVIRAGKNLSPARPREAFAASRQVCKRVAPADTRNFGGKVVKRGKRRPRARSSAGEGSAGKTPPGYHSHGEPRTSPNLPEFTPPALANAAQPASHRHVISYQQTGQHSPLLEGGSRASSAPPAPRCWSPPRTHAGPEGLRPRSQEVHAEICLPGASRGPPSSGATSWPNATRGTSLWHGVPVAEALRQGNPSTKG